MNHRHKLDRVTAASGVVAAIAMIAALLALSPIPGEAATNSSLCYIVADRGGGNGGDDRLVTYNRDTDAFTAIGSGTGTYNIEAADLWPGNDTLYAIDANR
ncbi:MAG: hypothetical protein ACN4GZ_13740, partial [Acidimicrobiales bacterium]